jgi:hypothetical protein
MSLEDLISDEINGMERAIEKHLLSQTDVLRALIQVVTELRTDVAELKEAMYIIDQNPEKHEALKEAYDKYVFVRKMTLGK